MQVLINGSPLDNFQMPEKADLAAFLKSISAKLEDEGCLIAGLKIDGEEVTGQEPEAKKSLTSIQCIEIHARRPLDMSRDSLELSREWLAPLSKQVLVCIDHLRLAQDEQGLQAFMQVVNGIEILFVGSSQALGMLESHFKDLGLQPALKVVEALPALLDELIDAQQRKDWTMLADILEYKLLEHFEAWKKEAQALETVLEGLHA
jgi:hypothetical protein